MPIIYTTTLDNINWSELVKDLEADNFHNHRAPEELARSFQNSYAVAFAWDDDRIIGKARVLSDGVCNAYVVDVWTQSAYRRQGVARRLMALLEEKLNGQHVYLFTDEAEAFYHSMDFKRDGIGMGKVVGKWLGRY